MSEPPLTLTRVVDSLNRLLAARLQAMNPGRFATGGVVAFDGDLMVTMLAQMFAIWASADPEAFGYTMQLVVGEAPRRHDPEIQDAQRGLASWLSDHALGRCTDCRGDIL